MLIKYTINSQGVIILPTNNNDEILRMASERLGVDKEALCGNGENLLNKLSSEDKEKVSRVLADKELTRKVLSTPKAQELLNKLLGDKKNGN